MICLMSWTMNPGRIRWSLLCWGIYHDRGSKGTSIMNKSY